MKKILLIFMALPVPVLFYWGVLFLPCAPVMAGEPELAVVVSSHIRPFVQAMNGFRSKMSEPMVLSYVDSNPELVRHRLLSGRFELVIAIGPAAARMVCKDTSAQARKLYLMVLDPWELLGRSALCGVHLRISPLQQFRMITERMGPGRRVGVLYNPAENGQWIVNASAVAPIAHVSLVPVKVGKREDVSQAFSDAARTIDTLLFIPDSTVISEAMVTYLVKNALLKGIAPVGYNRFFLETGSVMAFVIDYEKCGEVGAGVAMDILAGRSCSMLPPPFEVGWNRNAWELVQQAQRVREERGRPE